MTTPPPPAQRGLVTHESHLQYLIQHFPAADVLSFIEARDEVRDFCAEPSPVRHRPADCALPATEPAPAHVRDTCPTFPIRAALEHRLSDMIRARRRGCETRHPQPSAPRLRAPWSAREWARLGAVAAIAHALFSIALAVYR